MSGIGFSELIILLLIGLIVLGPERLPRVANQLGGWIGKARRMTRVLKRQLEEEMDLGDIQDIVPPARTKHSGLGFEPPTSAAGLAATTTTANTEKDDTWSAAHDAESAGTGVGDSPADEGASNAAASAVDEKDKNEKGQA
ncbi:MAG: twin-arginine translocase subunit TatB [Woeseia sp.]|nr:Sec-independent protein translocase protein TatB [Woeseia sp.]MBT8097524.1 Sec-independent protein translocase protein TatB [Woeseia sp.]NNE59608.1 twin-arginine translocase subunit TatB [Woeseia sp.]NNL55221.1 twin-arginine translocase subunit TatB [Woeseia sp.]